MTLAARTERSVSVTRFTRVMGICAAALWLAGVALFLGVSWFEVMDQLGAWVLKTIDWIRTRIDQRRELASGQQRKQARQEVVRVEQKKVANRPPPRYPRPRERPGSRARPCPSRAAGNECTSSPAAGARRGPRRDCVSAQFDASHNQG